MIFSVLGPGLNAFDSQPPISNAVSGTGNQPGKFGGDLDTAITSITDNLTMSPKAIQRYLLLFLITRLQQHTF